MNEQTIQLIQHIADKLGTTAEHLWAVLCRQAPISATVDAVMDVAVATATWAVFRFVRRKTTPVKTKYEGGYEREEAEWEDGRTSAWILWTLLAIIAVVLVVTTADDIAAGFVNPEYWVYKQILK